MLKLVYGDAAVTMKMVYKWFERFRNGCEWLKTRRGRDVQHQKPKRMLKE